MDRNEMINVLSQKLGVDQAESEKVLNEILSIQVVPNLFRKSAIQRIADITALDKNKAELAVNEFVGLATSRAALFEEVVQGFARGLATENKCDDCNGCDACDSVTRFMAMKSHLADLQAVSKSHRK